MNGSTFAWLRPRSILLMLSIVVIAIYAAFPIYWMIVSGFRTPAGLYENNLLPGPFGVRSYTDLFILTDFSRYLLNSTIVSIGATALTLLVATPMAYALVRGRLKGAMLLVRGMLFAYMFPPLLMLIPIYIMMVRTGLDGTLLSLIVSYQSATLPLAVWMLWSFFKTLPVAVEEAALIDGCTRWQILYKIILPISLPGLLTVTIFAFLISWAEFIFPLVIASGESLRPVTYGLFQIAGTYASDWGVLMAGATLAALPLIVALMFLGRYFIEGLAAGAVK